jgi:hypothetical protein
MNLTTHVHNNDDNQNKNLKLVSAALDLVQKFAVLSEEEQDEIFVEVMLNITRIAFSEKEQGFSGVCTRIFENIVENPISSFESLSEAEKVLTSIIE